MVFVQNPTKWDDLEARMRPPRRLVFPPSRWPSDTENGGREGRRHGRRRIERLMREMGLSARLGGRRAPRTTDSHHDQPIAPNLLARTFSAVRPDQVWLADISYLPTDEGWLYLAAIKDMATRQSSAGRWPTT
jgi:transposase InsO family protein